MIPAKIYPVLVPANGSYPLLVEAEMFKLLEVSGGSIRVTGDSFGTIGDIKAGQGLEATPFKRITFTDTTGSPQVLQVLVASSRFIDDRITGDVSVIDGNKSRTIAGGSFAWRCSVSSVAQPHGQLWNPVGSGKLLIVDALLLTSSIAGSISVGMHNVQLATPGQAPQNLNTGSSDVTVALGRVQDVALMTFTRNYGACFVPTNGSVNFTDVLCRPIVVAPGTGMAFQSESTGVTVTGWVSFFEENA